MNEQKSILVVFYSRTGFCAGLGREMAEALDADIEELVDTKDRSGVIGFAVAGKDAALSRDVPCEPVTRDISAYDMVIVGTPVWANTMATAVRSFLKTHGPEIKAASLYCCTRSSGIDSTLVKMGKLLDCGVAASTGFMEKQVKKGLHTEQMTGFIADIRTAL